MFASDAAIREKHQELCGFARAYAKGALFLITNPGAALHMWWVVAPAARHGATDQEATRNGIDELLQIAKTYDIGFPPQQKYGSIDKKEFKEYMELLKQEGVITTVPDVNDIVTDSFVGCMNQFDGDAVRKLAREWKY